MLSFDEYQRQVGESKIYPRLFTEDQVRQMMLKAAALEARDAWYDEDEILDQFTTPLNRLIYAALGLVGEAGEFAQKIKKIVRDHNGVLNLAHEDALGFEAGDALWYVAAIADDLGFPLSDVAAENQQKIASRTARGKIKGEGDNR